MLPLERYRVIDLGTAFAGSMPGQYLADLGAQVVKVEARTRPDGLRFGPGPVLKSRAKSREDLLELNPNFHAINRGKQGITVDITSREGIRLARELVRVSDVWIDNFTPDVLPKYGLDYRALRQVNPTLVMASLSVAGQEGPLRDTRAYANTITALSGLSTLLGYEDTTYPEDLHIAYGDTNAAIFCAFAVLTALFHRRKTGRGQFIDLSAWESTACLLGEPMLEHQFLGIIPGHQGSRHPYAAPHGNYPCRGDDAWVCITVTTEEEWQGLCRAMGRSDWAQDPRFVDGYARTKNRAALDSPVAEWTRQRTPQDASALLQREGVPAAPVLTVRDRATDPALRQRYINDVAHPMFGMAPVYAMPWRLKRTPPQTRGPAPLLGQHNADVFGKLLGLPSGDMQTLIKQGVL
ncbi:MAG: CoA transferase [Dehalococcoidia bacterium]|nr:CoA transferase [Dehalococcoidia bacterium]